MSRILCIGSVAKDIFFPTSEGSFIDTPDDILSRRKVMFEVGAKYQIEDRYEALGGVAANMSVGLARLGLSVSCVGAIGDDEIGSWIRRELLKEHVDLGLLRVFPNVKSDLSMILVFANEGDRTIFYNRDAAEQMNVSLKQLPYGEWVVVSALNGDWKSNLREVLHSVRDRGLKLAINPGQRNMKDDPMLVLEAIGESHVLLLNKDEAVELVVHAHSALSREDLENEYTLLKALASCGAKRIALTDGVRGAWGLDENGNIIRSISKSPSHGIETTGAGDAFGSAFLAATLEGKSLEDSLRWGMVNGSSVVQYFGAIEGLLQRDSIEMNLDSISIE